MLLIFKPQRKSAVDSDKFKKEITDASHKLGWCRCPYNYVDWVHLVEREKKNSPYSLDLVLTHMCSECGTALAADDIYCPHCGGKIL